MSVPIAKAQQNRRVSFYDLTLKYVVFLLFALMVLIYTLLSPSFLSGSNLLLILGQASMLGIASYGMTIVMMTKGIDLSIGSLAGLAALVGVGLMVHSGTPVLLGILLGVAVAACMGMFSGLLVSRAGVAPFVVTLSTMFLAQGFQYMVSDGGQSIGYGFPLAYLKLGSDITPIILFLIITGILYFVTEFTVLGRNLKATGANPSAAELSGVNVRNYITVAYALSAALAAIAGFTLGARQGYVEVALGDSFLMDALITTLLGQVAFGGRPLILGTAFGVIFLCSFETGISMMGAPVTTLNILKGFLLLLTLLLSSLQSARAK
ncbi:MAG: ABC transporter permease [Firmicutes bacterium]|nr:ABC transporter permease [Bacillota bacterium]